MCVCVSFISSATAGYHSARLFRTLKGNNWKKAASLVSNSTNQSVALISNVLVKEMFLSSIFLSPDFVPVLLLMNYVMCLFPADSHAVPRYCVWGRIFLELLHLG